MDEVLDVIIQAATRAGKLALEMRDAATEVHEVKHEDASFSVKADIETERFLFAYLREHMPVSFGILSEESGDVQQGDDLQLVIDPIDGTYNYQRGLPDFGVSIGIVMHGKPVGGVIYLPVLDILISGYAGMGVFCNGQPVRFNPAYPNVMVGIETSSKHMHEDLIKTLNGNVKWERRLCAVSSIVFAILGRYDGILLSRLKPWDVAAGIALLQEAGAKVLALNEDNLTVNSTNILAGSPQVIETLETTLSLLFRSDV